MDDRDNKNYITSRVHPIFEKMIIDLLLEKPDDLVDYMIQWLQDKGSQFKAAPGFRQAESMRELLPASRVISSKNQIGKLKVPANEDLPSSEEDSDDEIEEEDQNDNLNSKSIGKILQQKQQLLRRRESVSAEVFGLFNKRQALTQKVVQKKAEQKERIQKKLNNLFMFMTLDDKEKQQLTDWMEEKRLRVGEYLYKRGDQADSMYLVESGQLECYQYFESGERQLLKTYSPGDSLGELAVLYISNRINYVVAKSDALLWQLDRNTYTNLLKESATNKKKKYEQLFSKIGLLQAMNPYEKTQISDAIKTVKYSKGDYVIKQGEQGDMFFMVEEGELVALKVKIPGGEPEQVMSYKQGQYFGELALIKNQPRQASVLCKSNCRLLSLDRYSFKRLLGPAEVILKRNTEIYESIKMQ